MSARLALALALLLALPGAAARADDLGPWPEDRQDGRPGLMEQGGRLLFRHMLRQMAPALRDMQDGLGGALTDMRPALRELSDLAGDLSLYDAPEVLPNGDILIRRKPHSGAGRDLMRFGTPNPDGTVDL
ncbi:MAG: hypothetical protein ACKVPY_05540 [Paracoccaceae bacterium]